MSLVRLLEIGRSLNAIKDTQSRYRMQRQHLLPKFGMAGSATVFHPMTASAPTSGTGLCPRSGSRMAPESGTEAASELQWNWIRRAFLKPFGCLADFLTDALKLCKALGIRIAGVFGFNSIWRHVPSRPYLGPLNGEFQAELSLDNVTVVRNDLSDADLRLSPMPNVNTNQNHIQSPDLVVNTRPVNAAWEAIKTRFLRVPIGYQDESGFHRGEIMAKKEIGWPPFW